MKISSGTKQFADKKFEKEKLELLQGFPFDLTDFGLSMANSDYKDLVARAYLQTVDEILTARVQTYLEGFTSEKLIPEEGDINEIILELNDILAKLTPEHPFEVVSRLQTESNRIVNSLRQEIRLYVQEKRYELQNTKKEVPNTEYADKLYEQIKALSEDWKNVNDVKAQLIIEYANDAIGEYKNTNQEKKIELRQIIAKAEQIVPPDSVDSLKKRGEKYLLKIIYPKTTNFRNGLLLIIGIVILVGIFLPLFPYIQNFIQSKQQVARKHAIFLVDITQSLSDSEMNQVINLTKDIVDKLPENTNYSVYPIQENTGRILSIAVADEEFQDSSNNTTQKKAERKDRLFKQINEIQNRQRNLPVGRQSCIINSLSAINQELSEINKVIKPESIELFIISDMQEDCKVSPLGDIRLTDETINRLTEKMSFYEWSNAPNLTNVRVTIIYPLTPDSITKENMLPSDKNLREFWKMVFKKCGIKEEWFWDNEHITWIQNGQIPRRLTENSK